MYIPNAFKEEDPSKLFGLIERNSFGLLVSNGEKGLEASPLPFLVDRAAGPHGALLSHMAKANFQWDSLNGREVLAVFQGPHAYVSPTWYETQEAVPTWNYAAVHVYGKFVASGSEWETAGILEKMVRFYEASMPQPWDPMRLPEGRLGQLLKLIVGFRIEINRMEGKWKLSQNHPEHRRRKVAEALEKGGPGAQSVAQLMREEFE